MTFVEAYDMQLGLIDAIAAESGCYDEDRAERLADKILDLVDGACAPNAICGLVMALTTLMHHNVHGDEGGEGHGEQEQPEPEPEPAVGRRGVKSGDFHQEAELMRSSAGDHQSWQMQVWGRRLTTCAHLPCNTHLLCRSSSLLVAGDGHV